MPAKGNNFYHSYLCYMKIIAIKKLMSHYYKFIGAFQNAACLYSMGNYSKETSGRGIF